MNTKEYYQKANIILRNYDYLLKEQEFTSNVLGRDVDYNITEENIKLDPKYEQFLLALYNKYSTKELIYNIDTITKDKEYLIDLLTKYLDKNPKDEEKKIVQEILDKINPEKVKKEEK